MKYPRLLLNIIIFFLLTVFTQVGGVIWLLGLYITRWLPLERMPVRARWWSSFAVRFAFYLAVTFLVVPPLARIFGRVPLPVSSSGVLKPRTLWTAIGNRHYVRPELRRIAMGHAEAMAAKYPGLQVNYFDANFPFSIKLPFRSFRRGFPLFPHLSHNDGKKLDLGFVYRDAGSGELSDRTPSGIGYGISEEPLPGEYDRPAACRSYFTYSFMRNLWPQGSKKDYRFDPALTRELIAYYGRDKQIGKILLEPHLTTRLSLGYGKISGVQCGSVRHDDHFHVQIP
jgi:hypothetical protein